MSPRRQDLIPASLPCVTAMGRHKSGRAWLARLPRIIGELSRAWRLRPGAPIHGGSCSWVAPAWREEDPVAPLILKVTWPHQEARGEGAALRLWNGRGAVRVHDHDPERYALLLERCEPGTQLARSHGMPADGRLLAGTDVLRELWRAKVPAQADDGSVLERLDEVAETWSGLVEERAGRDWPQGVDTGLFTLASRLLRELPRSAHDAVVLHGDFNPGNVLAARRRPWLAIDAKPMVGDPAYDPWPLIEQIDDPFAARAPASVLSHRTRLVSERLGLEARRVLAWAFARHVESFLAWVTQSDDLADSVVTMERARTLADLAEL